MAGACRGLSTKAQGKTPPLLCRRGGNSSRDGAATGRLWAGEGRRVLHRSVGPAPRIEVGAGDAGLAVGDAERDLDVGQATGEYPEVVVHAAAVQHLHRQLDVVGAEEPELAEVVRLRQGVGWSGAVQDGVRGPPGRLDLEPAAVEAQRGRTLDTDGGPRHRRQDVEEDLLGDGAAGGEPRRVVILPVDAA